jgi:hypothetical protein
MRKCLISLSLLLVCAAISAQERALFTWKQEPSFHNISQISGDQNILFAASEFGLFSYRSNDTPNVIGQEVGRWGSRITALKFNKNLGVLLLGYEDGVIDFISAEDIKSDHSLATLDARLEKTIHDITFTVDRAFLASDLGVVEYLLDDQTARDIYRNIGTSASPVTVFQLTHDIDSLYAFTDQGLLVGNVNSNLLDFTQWTSLDNHAYDQQTKVGLLEGLFYVASEQQNIDIVRKDGTVIERWTFQSPIKDIKTLDQQLLVVTDDQVWEVSTNDRRLLISTNGGNRTGFVQSDNLWLGTTGDGLMNPSDNQILFPNGPNFDQPVKYAEQRNKLYIFNNQQTGSQYFEGSWTRTDSIVDIADWGSDTILLTTEGRLIEKSTGQFIDIPGSNGTPADLLIVEGTIWVSFLGSTVPVHSTTDFISWNSYSSNQVGTDGLNDMKLSLGGVLYGRDVSNRLIAFDPFDQSSRVIDFNDGLTGEITDYDIDVTDVLFVTTTEGLMTAPDATFIFNNEDLSLAFITNGQLIATDYFTAIEIDPGDRKWLATTDGLWLYNPALSKQITHLTPSNSELLSNDIYSLFFQSANGLLWLSTGGGLISYQTNALEGQLFHQNVKIFPNPISISRDQHQIGFSGIPVSSQVKITTLTGRFIDEVFANGGLTSWNLTDSYGNIVTPGIYLFFSSDDTGEDSYIGKLLVEP